ncbi:MAG TPA: DUF3108 domain-containing protein [Blastocatellia bacterium]|nr:DUF3108 domain-containing protein [Blastocatellia bacterium]
MLKQTFVAAAIIALLFSFSPAQTRSIKADRVPALKFSPSVGERLNYDVSWSDFIVAGELTIETKDRRSFDGVDGFHVSAQAQSVGMVSAFVYKVNDIYESFLSAATLQPFRAQKNSRRGKKRASASVIIDQQRRTARLDDGRTIEIPPDTYDLAGLIFAIRAIDLTPGKARVFNVLEEDKLYKISVEPEGTEKVTTPAGSFDTVRIATRTIGGTRDSNLYNLKMRVTNDARRLPVEITAEPSWGSVRVRLTSMAGTNKK